MRILSDDALTFDDVLLVPQHSTVLPREVSLSTPLVPGVTLNIPLLSSPMDTVTEAALAIALAQEGGIGIIHKNMSISEQADAVKNVKKFESGVVNDPYTIAPDASVEALLDLVNRFKISGVPVVEGKQLVGIVTRRDWRFETELKQKVSDIMTPKSRLVTVLEGVEANQVLELLRKHKLEKLLVVSNEFELRGMFTVKDFEKAKDKPLSCKDKAGKLCVGAAVGVGPDTETRVKALINAGVDVVVVDTAHGHSQGVLDTVKMLKAAYPKLSVIGGNIVTAEAALDLVKAGADAVKVGIGPGSICTTRVVTGVGMPQISAVAAVAEALRKTNVSVIADGGIRYSGDIPKAIAAGAHCVMVGSMLAGTDEAPGEIVLYQGRSYKGYRGMGSLGAMAAAHGSSDRYFQENTANQDKFVPEGIEGRVPYRGSMVSVVHQLMGGLRSAMGYLGTKNIQTLREKGHFVRITAAAVKEGHVHDVSITKEAPNYRTEG